jgi:hypothetical protein
MEGLTELCAAERALQAAILAGDLPALDAALDDRMVHVGADGTPQDKRELLAARASNRMHLIRLEEEALEAVVEGSTGIVRSTLSLAGFTQDVLYTWRIVITRTWAFTDRWRVLAEHLSLVEPRVPAREHASRVVGKVKLHSV